MESITHAYNTNNSVLSMQFVLCIYAERGILNTVIIHFTIAYFGEHKLFGFFFRNCKVSTTTVETETVEMRTINDDIIVRPCWILFDKSIFTIKRNNNKREQYVLLIFTFDLDNVQPQQCYTCLVLCLLHTLRTPKKKKNLYKVEQSERKILIFMRKSTILIEQKKGKRFFNITEM